MSRRFALSLLAIAAVIVSISPAAAAEEAHPLLVSINESLELMGVNYRVAMAEYLTTTDGPEFGGTIFANDRGNKQLPHHFVPGDARRAWSGPGTSISWINDLSEGGTTSGLSAAMTAAAIGRATGTWQAETCSNIPLASFGNHAFDFGVVQFILGFGGSPFIFADLTHGGWLPRGFFDALTPGCIPPNCGGDFILGVTFTFTFTGTDIDNNGKRDTAFREIYYNDNFFWAINGHFDVETVALHEIGHGLSQAHFGLIFRNPAGKLRFSPFAVMNAAYSRVAQTLVNTDIGGHCSIWASWPQN